MERECEPSCKISPITVTRHRGTVEPSQSSRRALLCKPEHAGSATTLPFLENIQRSFGAHDVSGIEAHVGGTASQACHDIGSLAYATGNHVAFRKAPDLHTVAYEAAHIVQQRARVHFANGVGQEGDEYERHADRVADAVVAGRSAEALLGLMGSPASTRLSGGYIRNACLRATFLAAQEETALHQHDLERAVALEVAELSKLSTAGRFHRREAL